MALDFIDFFFGGYWITTLLLVKKLIQCIKMFYYINVMIS